MFDSCYRAMIVLLLSSVVLCLPAFAAEGVSDERAAMMASVAFLDMADAGQFESCWEEASSLFRERTTQKQWFEDMVHLRKALGKPLKRSIQFQKSMTSIDDGPDGEYRFFIYRTVFERKASAIETVTVMRDQDGAWRVVGLTTQ